MHQVKRLLSLSVLLNSLAGIPALAQTAPPVPANPPVSLTPAEALGEVQTPLAPLPAALPAAPSAQTVAQEFPRYASLKPAVDFWTQVFRDYSELQSVIHSDEYPAKVFAVLDFTGDAARMSPNALYLYRQKSERRAKQRVDDLLSRVHAKRHAPATLSDEERAVYELYADVEGDRKFLLAQGTARAQRGLKERTAEALEVSRQYLPEMERIFASYGLPKELTRLPLVESSFNIEAYSKVGAAGLWQFIPSSARIYMRLDEVVDDRRDPWTSTDAAARHLRDDYQALGAWPLALTAYNHGRSGIAAALRKVNGRTLPDLIARYESRRFGFASRNFYAEFLAALDVEREYRRSLAPAKPPAGFELVEVKHYVPYETLRKLSGLEDAAFRQLNPAYRREVMDGKLHVPPGHAIRLPSGSARQFQAAYASLGDSEVYAAQRAYYQQHQVRKGEHLGRIARSYGVTAVAIADANGMRTNKKLRAGQVLKIPPRVAQSAHPVAHAVHATPLRTAYRTHKVRSGQTLSSIARRYGVSVAALQHANDLISAQIRSGMKLKVPSAS